MGTGRVGLVTGANKGIGFQVSRELARLNHRVLIGARNTARGAGAAADLSKEMLCARIYFA